MSYGGLIFYSAVDDSAVIKLRAEGRSVWLTQAQIGTLFDMTPQSITQHIEAIHAESELPEKATCMEFLQVTQEGDRTISRNLKHYNAVLEQTEPRLEDKRGDKEK